MPRRPAFVGYTVADTVYCEIHQHDKVKEGRTMTFLACSMIAFALGLIASGINQYSETVIKERDE